MQLGWNCFENCMEFVLESFLVRQWLGVGLPELVSVKLGKNVATFASDMGTELKLKRSDEGEPS